MPLRGDDCDGPTRLNATPAFCRVSRPCSLDALEKNEGDRDSPRFLYRRLQCGVDVNPGISPITLSEIPQGTLK